MDSVNRFLYVVDHKKKVIKRINLQASQSVGNEAASSTGNAVTTVLSSETTPDIGDIFYMTIYDKAGTAKLVWSEFSGKIKMSNLNDAANYKLIFSTNEYTYSINLMDNSTYSFVPPLAKSSTTHVSNVHTTDAVTTSQPLPSTTIVDAILLTRNFVSETTTEPLSYTSEIKL